MCHAYMGGSADWWEALKRERLEELKREQERQRSIREALRTQQDEELKKLETVLSEQEQAVPR